MNAAGKFLLTTVALTTVALFAGCANIGPKPLPKDFDASPQDLKTLAGDTQVNDTYNKDKARQLFDAGVLISNQNLEAFFASFDTLQRKVAHHQNLMNITTGAAVGVLGYTGATPKTLALIGIGQAAANAEFQNYTGIFLLSPTLDLVRKKLTESRRTYASKMRMELANVNSFGRVREMIAEYDATGSLLAIREYVRSSAELVSFDVIDREELIMDTAVLTHLNTLKTELHPDFQAMDRDVAFALYLKASGSSTYTEAVDAAGKVAPATPFPPGFGTLATILTKSELATVTFSDGAIASLNALSEKLGFAAKATALKSALDSGNGVETMDLMIQVTPAR